MDVKEKKKASCIEILEHSVAYFFVYPFPINSLSSSLRFQSVAILPVAHQNFDSWQIRLYDRPLKSKMGVSNKAIERSVSRLHRFDNPIVLRLTDAASSLLHRNS
jgi:hypothetical protein